MPVGGPIDAGPAVGVEGPGEPWTGDKDGPTVPTDAEALRFFQAHQPDDPHRLGGVMGTESRARPCRAGRKAHLCTQHRNGQGMPPEGDTAPESGHKLQVLHAFLLTPRGSIFLYYRIV